MREIKSYPKIFNFGHKELEHFFMNDLVIEEKIDGSQFSFGVFYGELCARSKGVIIDLYAPADMFKLACDTAQSLKDIITPEYTYRCEYLSKPKHNSLKYDRVPKNNLIVFDIDTGEQNYLSPEDKKKEADRIGLETVPHLFTGKISSFNEVLEFMKNTSCLGGALIEGMVFKNYEQYGADKKVLLAKYVSEEFKEIHKKEWRSQNQAPSDIKEIIVDQLRSDARWHKSIQHLRENGTLENSPKDIGLLMKEIVNDVKLECEDLIKEQLFAWAWKDLSRKIVRGFPQWYKDRLIKEAIGD